MNLSLLQRTCVAAVLVNHKGYLKFRKKQNTVTSTDLHKLIGSFTHSRNSCVFPVVYAISKVSTSLLYISLKSFFLSKLFQPLLALVGLLYVPSVSFKLGSHLSYSDNDNDTDNDTEKSFQDGAVWLYR